MCPICACYLPTYPKEVKSLSDMKPPDFSTPPALTVGDWYMLGVSIHTGNQGTETQ